MERQPEVEKWDFRKQYTLFIYREYHCFDEGSSMMESLSSPRGAKWIDVGMLSRKKKRSSLRRTSGSFGGGGIIFSENTGIMVAGFGIGSAK
jgi:hypothetical protein